MPRKKKETERKIIHTTLRLDNEMEARVWSNIQPYIEEGRLSEYLRDLMIKDLLPAVEELEQTRIVPPAPFGSSPPKPYTPIGRSEPVKPWTGRSVPKPGKGK